LLLGDDPFCCGKGVHAILVQAGRKPVATTYYCCSDRHRHGKNICKVPSTLRAEQIEDWVLGKLGGVHTDATREVIATYVNKIVIWPSQKPGEMHLNPASRPLWKDHGRPDGRSWSNAIGARRVDSKTRPEDRFTCQDEASQSLVLAFVWGPRDISDAL